ncbi:hypothetical protein AAMO2058_000083500 [Amorphochlora amoebiformis]
MSPPPSFPGIMIKIFLISLVPPVIGGTSGVNFQRGLQRVQVFAVRRPGVCRGLAERLRGLGRGKAARGEDFGIRRVTASVSLSQDGEPLTKDVAKQANRETADKLIKVFGEQPKDTWKHLLGFSNQWWEVANDVFERIGERANGADNADEELRLRRMGRQLREIHEEVFENRRVWTELKEMKPEELDDSIQRNLDRISSDSFFEYIRDMVGRTEHSDDYSDIEKKAVKALSEKILASVQELAIGVDREVKDNFQKILSSGSKEGMKKEIDRLAESGNLDPRYLALMEKAYATGSETWFTKEDHEETTLYMYEQMRISMRKQQPLEIRLLKYVLAFPTSLERRNALEEVLTPGVRFDDEGWMTAETTSPEAMLSRVEDLMRKYKLNLKQFKEIEPRPMDRAVAKGREVEAETVMRDIVVDSVYMYVPEVIERLREIRMLLKKEFIGQLPNGEKPEIGPDGLIKTTTPGQRDVMLQGDNFVDLSPGDDILL